MKYFTIEELTRTETGLQNNPSPAQIDNLTALVTNILDPARYAIGLPIKVNSGFRSPSVNAKVGGVKTSQHLKGEAADLTCENNKKLFEIIKDNLVFDQLIWEHGGQWIHVSFSQLHNRQNILNI